jgi:hypothetical protein
LQCFNIVKCFFDFLSVGQMLRIFMLTSIVEELSSILAHIPSKGTTDTLSRLYFNIYIRAFNIIIHYTHVEFSVYKTRSLCSIMYPHDPDMISRYAKRCIKLGIHLEDAILLLQVCRPLQKRIHSAIFYINICITVFSLQNLNGILKQMTWRSAASVSWTNNELKSLQRWD